MSEYTTIPKNVLTVLRKESLKKKHTPTKQDIENLLREPDLQNWILKTFGKKPEKVVNYRNLQEKKKKENAKEEAALKEAATLIKILKEQYPQLIPREFSQKAPATGPIFEFIFVRHGESCANAIHETVEDGLIKHKFYLDPELTEKGQKASEQKSKFFLDTLETAKNSQFTDIANYIVGSSPLLRAQETAYLMIARPKGIFLNVMPYLGEITIPSEWVESIFSKLGISSEQTAYPDNIPQSPDEQEARLRSLYGETFLKGDDWREDPYDPSFKKFLDWAVQNADKFPKVNGVHRAILFTHSNLLKSRFLMKNCLNDPAKVKPPKLPKPLHKNKLGNNDFLVTIFNPTNQPLEGMQFLQEEAVFPKWYYYDTRDNVPDVKCGFETRRCQRLEWKGKKVQVPVTTPCAATGGKRKTRRSRLRRRRRSTRRRFH